ncbi:inositol monophosphatase family protein [Neptunicoccus cionae]|uniref:inositol monophosphatase family protein n=1 Tax=Neptunicoccus cionae TaxID=2035344 RepID=UPI000C7606FF|nr:inositol monophosphatase family protein [Amylibacter cionae]PLS23535.1 histidinol-phosphatase [Amylibacter cionae]
MPETAPLSSALHDELLRVAHLLADAARPIALQYFRGAGQDIENKLDGDFDPVTVADRLIERKMREILAQHRPQDSILGEEFAAYEGTSGLTWVLDPIDGTRGFISGTPTWGVLIAVGPEGGPLIGMIDQPFTGERFIGTPKQAQWLHPSGERALGTRTCGGLQDAILFTTFPEIGTQHEQAAFNRVRDRVKLTRYGIDCYAYGLLAAGQVDLVIEAGLNAYDIQGPLAVIEAAGGIVTDWHGEPAYNGGQVIAAGDPSLHAAALTLLQADGIV